jgi:hypothetical protein
MEDEARKPTAGLGVHILMTVKETTLIELPSRRTSGVEGRALGYAGGIKSTGKVPI